MNVLLIFTFKYKYLKYKKKNIYNLGNKTVFYLYNNAIVLTVLSECKRNSGTASMNTDSQWSKQEACFGTCDFNLGVDRNHNTSVTSEAS